MDEGGYNSEIGGRNYSEQNYLFPELKYELENKDLNGQYNLFSGISAERKNYKSEKNYDNTKNLFDNDPELF